MSMTVRELRAWLAQFEAHVRIGIDEGGLILVAENGAYLEVGGEPEKDTDQ